MELGTRISGYYQRLIVRTQALTERLVFGRKSLVTRPKTLLLVRLDSIGDYVLFRNFIQVLKTSDRYRGYRITLCGNTWWKDLAEQLDAGSVDEFIWVDYARLAERGYRTRLFGQVHAKGFEVLIHPTYSRDALSDDLVKYSGARHKTGYNGDLINLTPEQKKINDAVYTQLVPSPSKFEFEFYRNKHFFEQVLQQPISLKKPWITATGVEQQTIIVCPGAKAAFRRWAPLKFAELCKRLQAELPDCRFAICGSAADSVFAAEIMAASDIPFTDHTGKLSLAQLLDVFSGAKLIITNDSGPFHLAVALDKQVLCLSNGNNYGRFTPYPQDMQTRSTVVYPDELLNTRPEAQRLLQFCREGSPLDINSIEVSAVYTAIKTKLPALS